ncbi:MAG TPA: hypothetical protein VGP61_13815 [Gemmatimonadales bacterium]|jgi:hypothetical protein|nr:hypothetical protein [Gemmatimonadales bacterium]
MTPPRRLRRAIASFVLLAIALAGGPGVAGLEAYEHAHRLGPGHGHRIHFERRGGQDHDDGCRAWVLPSPARNPTPPSALLELQYLGLAAVGFRAPSLLCAGPSRLPHSRAPPATF